MCSFWQSTALCSCVNNRFCTICYFFQCQTKIPMDHHKTNYGLPGSWTSFPALPLPSSKTTVSMGLVQCQNRPFNRFIHTHTHTHTFQQKPRFEWEDYSNSLDFGPTNLKMFAIFFSPFIPHRCHAVAIIP